MNERLKWQVVSERWWDDDEKRNRWGYNVICPHCGPEMEWTGFTKIRTWKDAMSLAVMEAKRRLGMGVTMTDCKNLELARQWAADIDADRETLSQYTIDAAADLIGSLPNTIVDGDKLRDWAKLKRGKGMWSDSEVHKARRELLDELESLLPTPPAPRTMTEIEWSFSEHHRAEAEHSVYGKVVMMELDGTGDIVVLMDEGLLSVSPSALTPTGRKLRLIPDEDVPEAVADHAETEVTDG